MALQYPQVVQSSHISLTQTLDEIFVEFQHTLSAEQFQRFTQEHQLEIVKPESVDDAVEPGKLGPIDGGWLRSQQGIEFGQFYPQVQADE